LASLKEERLRIELLADPSAKQNSDIEPFDVNDGPHGFTADITDEVVRTFRYS